MGAPPQLPAKSFLRMLEQGEDVNIPVSSETYDLLQQIAYEQGQSLAAFCRDCIMAKENLNKAFNALQKNADRDYS